MSADPDKQPAPGSLPPSRWLSLWRAFYPPVLGVLAVLFLYAALFGIDFFLGAELRVMGVGDAATTQRVMTRYGLTLLRHQGRVLGFYVAIGAVMGLLIQLVIKLWERSGAWPSSEKRARSLETPLQLPPSPWPLGRRLAVSLLSALILHLFMLSRAIILRPALFAEALYDRGGIGKSLMVWLTHGSGGLSLWMLGVGLALFLVLAPLLSVRGRRFFVDLWLYHKPWLILGAVVLTAAWLYSRSSTDSSPKSATSSRPPSLLIIAVDSLRADRLFDDKRVVAPAMTELLRRSV